ncbi:MAG: DUF1549 domain-containing protein [Planctomycetaceae bacterium]|nr:DUF1549 domain-containing protein [Planctomycetaceae bacterium]
MPFIFFTLSRRFSLTVLVVASAFSFSSAFAEEGDVGKPDPASLQFFEQHVRPLLHAHCIKCHGENQQKGGLRLDSREALFKGGESGPAISDDPNDADLLMEAVRYESFEMPPDKPLSEQQIAVLQRWIDDGAVWPTVDGASVRLTGRVFSDEERGFWSLQPLHAVQPPNAGAGWAVNEIDRFIAARWEAAGIRPAAAATDRELVRRLYFDLIGLPASPEEAAEFLQSSDSDRWSRLVDTLLADFRYGEHWGRYWLDVVRYAESDGFRADDYRPAAWRYRDYVVNSFNDDKPFDRFVMEQIAGDEIAPERADALVATGFLRTYLYEYNQRDARTQWQDILDQVTDITGEAFLGMGVGCARCHDHKFDPILQEDYYRMQACFGTMIPRDDVPASDLADRQKYQKSYDEWLSRAADLRQELEKLRAPYLARAAKGATERFPEDIQEIMARPESERVPLEKQLADLVNRQIDFDISRMKYKDDDKARIDELEKQIAAQAGPAPPTQPQAITVSDLGPTPQPIHVAADRRRKVVPAGAFTILGATEFDVQPTPSSTGQRTALANWIASPENPLTARVIVNRVWQQHFGRGIVDTASDFGTLGGRPSHPELLDWLTTEFIRHGWSIKWLHRQILNSATWKLSSFHPDADAISKIDPHEELRWRSTVRRLNAEQIRDTMLSVSGELLSEPGGPSVDHNSLRRSLYLKAYRNKPEPLLRSLDGVDGLNSVPKRSTTTTPVQALNLMNGDWVRARAVSLAKRVMEICPDDDLAKIADGAFQTAFGRSPGRDELNMAVQMMKAALDDFEDDDSSRDRFAALPDHMDSAVAVGDTDNLSPLSTSAKVSGTGSPFTVAALIRLESLYPDATVRTIISQWDNNNDHRGWSLGVTSEKSAYKPRNLILQVVSDKGYEVVASNLRPELNRTYLVAVSVSANDDGTGKADFYLQPFGSEANAFETASVSFRSASGIAGDHPFVLGGRHNQKRHRWQGQLDQVLVFSKSLSAGDINELFDRQLSPPERLAPAAFWTFDNSEDPVADASANGNHLVMPTAKEASSAFARSVTDLCHVLMNANEFVYVD